MKRHPICNLLITKGGQVIGPRGKQLKPWISNGYRFVRALFPKTKSWKIARLVAETYIPNPENKPEINHKDGNKLNDRHSNLEWSTRIENANHAYKLGLQKPRMGENASGAKLNETAILAIRAYYKGGTRISFLADQYNVTHSNIHCIVNRKSWKHI